MEIKIVRSYEDIKQNLVKRHEKMIASHRKDIDEHEKKINKLLLTTEKEFKIYERVKLLTFSMLIIIFDLSVIVGMSIVKLFNINTKVTEQLNNENCWFSFHLTIMIMLSAMLIIMYLMDYVSIRRN